MIKMTDNITNDVLSYDDLEDFRSRGIHAFDESVHDSFNELCDRVRDGGYYGDYEAFLGITLDTEDYWWSTTAARNGWNF